MQLILSSQEWDILSRWAERILVGGRWGDGRLMLGEEEHILRVLEERPSPWEISFLEVRVLRYWIENLSFLSPAEKVLAEKIQSLGEK